jgi:hypothetical protein
MCAGLVLASTQAIGRSHCIDERYPGVAGGAERIVGRTDSGDMIVRRADCSEYTRPARRGDSYPAEGASYAPRQGEVVDVHWLECS